MESPVKVKLLPIFSQTFVNYCTFPHPFCTYSSQHYHDHQTIESDYLFVGWKELMRVKLSL